MTTTTLSKDVGILDNHSQKATSSDTGGELKLSQCYEDVDGKLPRPSKRRMDELKRYIRSRNSRLVYEWHMQEAIHLGQERYETWIKSKYEGCEWQLGDDKLWEGMVELQRQYMSMIQMGFVLPGNPSFTREMNLGCHQFMNARSNHLKI
jgi:hypothetical protein